MTIERKTAPGNRRGWTALAGFTCSTAELRTCVREDSNLRPYDYEVTALFTTGLDRNTIREQAIAETPAHSLPCRPGSALPLSYRRIRRRAGFEPATSRGSNDVTAIFTTDRDGSWRGTGDAVAALAGEPPFGVRGSNPLGAVAPLPRSNRHRHHRLADACASTIGKHAGERAISAFSDINSVSPFREEPEPWRVTSPCGAISTVRESQAGFEPALPWSEVSEIFTTSVG